MQKSVHLSVNVNKLATIRNARGKNSPDVVRTSLKIIEFGAFGITVHPRPDERHIRKQDVYDLKAALPKNIEFNIEGYPTDDFLRMVLDVKPAQCTLVPDPPEALTSNAGWDVLAHAKLLKEAAWALRSAGVRTSVFVDPATCSSADMGILAEVGVARVELYTESYAESFGTSQQETVTETYVATAKLASAAGLGVNAGHDLNLSNLRYLCGSIPELLEVSIGHQLICDALDFGMQETVARYLRCVSRA